ncbi:MAG TPA: hypothetical protein VMF33_00950, partial [Acidimicrobiales bacterium]|nr:hypothetical protein [Acidimicrobiales bacterium]
GLVVVVVTGGLVVVVVAGGLVVVVVAGGLVVVVLDEGVVVVAPDEGLVVEVADEGFDVEVLDEEYEDDGKEVVAPPDVGEVVDDRRVVAVPGFAVVVDPGEEIANVVVESLPLLACGGSPAAATDPTASLGWACINAKPPAAVVPSTTDPATRAA